MSGKRDLGAQISCAAREVALRRAVYPRQVAAGKMRGDLAEQEIALMEAIKATLTWLQSNEGWIKAAKAQMRAAEQEAAESRRRELEAATDHPAVAGVLGAFPGATVVGVRDTSGAGAV